MCIFMSEHKYIYAWKHNLQGLFNGAQLHVFIFMYRPLCFSVCVSTGGPAPPKPSSSAPPVSGLWWPLWGRLSLSRTQAPGWRTGRECPPAPSLLPDTSSQTHPPPRAEATSCVDRKQEGSNAAVVSAVTFGTQYLRWNPVDTLQQWFVYFVVILRKITLSNRFTCYLSI